MHLQSRGHSDRLPKRFPIGATYVIEGRTGEDGTLRVFSRYVVLPGGRRINLAADASARSAATRSTASRRSRRQMQAQNQAGGRAMGPSKKIITQAGTARQRGR
jgi:hypothetical protein